MSWRFLVWLFLTISAPPLGLLDHSLVILIIRIPLMKSCPSASWQMNEKTQAQKSNSQGLDPANRLIVYQYSPHYSQVASGRHHFTVTAKRANFVYRLIT